MHGVSQIYKRFFTGLKPILLLGLFLLAAEACVPYIVAALGRYTVDEVLEVHLLAPKNQLVEVPARATDAVTIDMAQLGRTRPVQVSGSRDMVSGNSPIMAQDNADRVPIPANLQDRPAQHKEALLLRQ